MSVKEITEQDFVYEVMEGSVAELPVLVEFYSDYCPPCRLVAPEVEALAKELEGNIRVLKLNIEHAPNVVQYLEITALPTFMLFKDGESVGGMQGAMRRSHLRKFVRQHVHLAS